LNSARTRVVGGEREQRPVELGHRLPREVLVDHETDVLHAGVNVGLELMDIAHFERLAGGRHDLHDPDGSDGAPRALS
jgi:hypothetical protein